VFNGELQHRAPQLCANTIGLCGIEAIDTQDSFDHVADSGREGTVGNTHRDNSSPTITSASNTAVDTNDSGRTAETGHNKIKFGGTLSKHSGSCRELGCGRRTHVSIVPKGCGTQFSDEIECGQPLFEDLRHAWHLV
jgi:hypothetical protein